MDDADGQFSPPTTPPVEGPAEKRGRQDPFEIPKDRDEESQINTSEAKPDYLSVQHHQSQVSIISMEEDEFDSDDEKVCSGMLS